MGMYRDSNPTKFAAKREAAMSSPELSGNMSYDRGKLYKGPKAFTGYETAQSQAQAAGGQAAQHASLRGLGQAANTGWGGIDALAMQQAQNQTAAGTSAQSQQAFQQAAGQGQLQGGAALRGALQAQRTGADQAAQAGQAFAAQGADMRASANQAQMNQGGAMGAEAMQRAASNDAFNQWAQSMQDQETATLRANATGRKQDQIDDDARMWGNIANYANVSNYMGGMAR
jgi:hypothetical protein